MPQTASADEILELRSNYMRAQNSGDAEGCVQHWDDDGLILPPNERGVRGKKALLEWYRGIFQHVSMKFELSYTDIHVSGEWSFANGTYHGHVVPKAGGNPIEDEGKFLEVHRRQPDGSWKFARHMWSSDKEGH
jgi:uncharacterized protein (TIGR02246 family)